MTETSSPPQYKFDPRTYERTIKVRGANDKDYLDVKWRVVWLRSEDWNARIETEKVHLDETSAVFIARITTTAGGLSVAHGSETKADFPDYIEKAESKAIGRALANLGYSEEWKTFVIDQRRDARDAARTVAAAAAGAHAEPSAVAPPAPVAPAPAAKAPARRAATAAPRLAPAATAGEAPTPVRPREADDRKAYKGDWTDFAIDDFGYVKERVTIGADSARELRDHLHARGYSALAALAHIHKLEAEAAAEGAIAAEQATQPHTLDELRPSLAKRLLVFSAERPTVAAA